MLLKAHTHISMCVNKQTKMHQNKQTKPHHKSVKWQEWKQKLINSSVAFCEKKNLNGSPNQQCFKTLAKVHTFINIYLYHDTKEGILLLFSIRKESK